VPRWLNKRRRYSAYLHCLHGLRVYRVWRHEQFCMHLRRQLLPNERRWRKYTHLRPLPRRLDEHCRYITNVHCINRLCVLRNSYQLYLHVRRQLLPYKC
jgi:hypothetical protein